MSASAPFPMTLSPEILSPSGLWTRYGPSLIDGLINLVAAGVMLAAGFWVAARISRAVRRLARKSHRVDETLAGFLSQIVRYALLGFVILAVLQRFGVETTSVVAVIGAATLAIGLALQGALSNVAAGVMLILFRPYRIGDLVEVAGAEGLIDDVGLFATTVRTLDGVMVTLPNGLCWGGPIRNFSSLPNRRIELKLSVSYETPLDLALEVVEEVLAADARVLDDPAPLVRVGALGASAVELFAYAWTKNPDWVMTRFDLIKAVKEAFDAEGIMIPYPTTMTYERRLDDPPPKPTRQARRRLASDSQEAGPDA
ncbi:MAG: mechanosensitive ion channel [Alphaproteobacteria bacterium]|jgi:small conductance mechanosensitive channel|nr:mechanosensitive ion channel [Alphaproteobacteria bacterium]